jgi:hypothetical protein
VGLRGPGAQKSIAFAPAPVAATAAASVWSLHQPGLGACGLHVLFSCASCYVCSTCPACMMPCTCCNHRQGSPANAVPMPGAFLLSEGGDIHGINGSDQHCVCNACNRLLCRFAVPAWQCQAVAPSSGQAACRVSAGRDLCLTRKQLKHDDLYSYLSRQPAKTTDASGRSRSTVRFQVRVGLLAHNYCPDANSQHVCRHIITKPAIVALISTLPGLDSNALQSRVSMCLVLPSG